MRTGAFKQLVFVSLLGLSIAGSVVAFAVGTAAGPGWRLALACLGAAVAILLLIILGLLIASAELSRSNRALQRRNRELQSASEAKSRFVANMSHELRNPLNAVIGFSELMQHGRLGPLAERQREHLGIIRASAQHLLTLINDALDVARIEAGHIRLEPEPVDPAAIATACAASLRTVAASRSIHMEIDQRPVGAVMLDPGRLRQVILNYLSNAIKFSSEGGRVTITLRREDGRLAVEVSDTGPGVDPADQGRVFDEFFQLPGRDRSGSGLGLAVTKLIVEAQRGEVGVRSTPGLGSTFYALLPAHPAWPIPAHQPSPNPTTRRAPALHRRVTSLREPDLARR